MSQIGKHFSILIDTIVIEAALEIIFTWYFSFVLYFHLPEFKT